MKDKYKEFAAEFKNEDEIEEELDDEGIELDDADREHFDVEDEKKRKKNTKI